MHATTIRLLLAFVILLCAFSPGRLCARVKLYTVSPVPDNQLRTIDPVSGQTLSGVALTMTGHVVLGGSGLATDPQTGQLYVLLDLQGQFLSELAVIDPGTGVATAIGPVDDGSGLVHFSALAFASDGALFGIGNVGGLGSLFRLDSATGQATVLAALESWNDALAFNPNDGLLYHAGNRDGLEFPYLFIETIDPANPAAAPVAILSIADEWYPTALVHWRGKHFLWVFDYGDWREGYLLSTPGGYRYLNAPADAISSMTFVGSPSPCPQPLYGAAYNGPDGPAVLYSIDKGTGATEAIGPIGFERVSGMDFGNNAVLFAAGERMDGSNTKVLLTIDPCTGEGAEIGRTGVSQIQDMSVRSTDGKLFAYASGDLVTLDAATGAGTIVGTPGNWGAGNALSFDLPGTTLYHAPSNSIFSIDPGIGNATFLSTMPGGTVLAAMDVDPASGTFYATWGLRTVDPGTGGVTVIAETTTPQLDALAFYSGTPQSEFTIAVVKSGGGTGTVIGGPIDCGATCSAALPKDTVVTLTATADTDSLFTGWSGACSGTGTCIVNLTSDRSVTATFQPAFALTVTLSGVGPGSVSSTPVGISCGATCSAKYLVGTQVSLQAHVPDLGSAFAGWGGDCSGTGSCEVTMDQARSVTAGFDAVPTYTLNVALAGTGSGYVDDGGEWDSWGEEYLGLINCPWWSCSVTVNQGTQIPLFAYPDGGSRFAGWSGGCAGTGDCLVIMDADKNVTATFDLIPTYDLHVTLVGTGSGAVTGEGINCGGDCSETYEEGAPVSLTATPAAGSLFAGWSGDCTGTGPCVVTMNQARDVTATFDLIPTFSLSVALAGTGSGSASSNPAGISCGATCAASYTEGTAVTLTAASSVGSIFAGWSGDCTGTGPCVVTMNQARNVTATFDLQPDFTFGEPPPPQTVSPGSSAQFIVGLGPVNGFDGTVAFACTAGLPQGAACSFAPPSLTPPGSTTLTITTTAPTVGTLWPAGTPLFAAWLPLMALVVAGGRAHKRRSTRFLLMLLPLLLLIAGCGGGGAIGGAGTPRGGTPRGSYTVTVTATGGGLSHAQTVRLVVN